MDSTSIKLIHYATEPVSLNPICYIQQVEMKPKGLWFSVEGLPDDTNWVDWCTDNEFRQDTLKYKHEIKLKEGSNVLWLNSISHIAEFNKRYFELECGMINSIDWVKVSYDYAGIIIAPYVWECRFEPSCFWYYGWDCASGCIWDLDQIESFELLKQKKANRV
jgi:hypothetical protein